MHIPDQAVLDGRLAFDAAPFDPPVNEEEVRLEREKAEREGSLQLSHSLKKN